MRRQQQGTRYIPGMQYHFFDKTSSFDRACFLLFRLFPYVLQQYVYTYVFVFIPFVILALSSPSLPVVTQIRGNIRSGSSPPLPTTVRLVPRVLSREEFTPLSSLVDSCRIVPTHAARGFQQLILVFCCIFAIQAKSHHGWDSNSRTNASSSCFFHTTCTFQLLDTPWSQVGVVPSPSRFLPSIFIAHRIQQPHCSSIFHRVLITHAPAFSASQFVHKKKSLRIYTSCCFSH